MPTLTKAEHILLASAEIVRNTGGLIVGGSFLGGFIGDDYTVADGLLAAFIGSIIACAGVYLMGLLKWREAGGIKPRQEGGSEDEH